MQSKEIILNMNLYCAALISDSSQYKINVNISDVDTLHLSDFVKDSKCLFSRPLTKDPAAQTPFSSILTKSRQFLQVKG